MSTHRLRRHAGRAGAVALVAGIATVLSAGSASAHVTAKVLGEPAEQGGYTKITFRVPNEEDAAGTIKVQVKLPQDTPLSSARTKAVPGWTAAVEMVTLAKPVKVAGAEIKEAVGTITWTANSGVRINPDEFAEFEVSGGPLPDNTDQLVLPTSQTYDNGKVVAWEAPPQEDGAEEPEHPAPVLDLAPPSEDGGHGHGAPAPDANGSSESDGSSESHASTEDSAASASDDTARWLGGAGLVVGALGLGLGAGATLRARRAVAAVRRDQS